MKNVTIHPNAIRRLFIGISTKDKMEILQCTYDDTHLHDYIFKQKSNIDKISKKTAAIKYGILSGC